MSTRSVRASTVLVLVTLSLCCSAVLAGDFGILTRPSDAKPEGPSEPPPPPPPTERLPTPEEKAAAARKQAEIARQSEARQKKRADDDHQALLKRYEPPIPAASLVGFETMLQMHEITPTYNAGGILWPHSCLQWCAALMGNCKSVVYDAPARTCYLHKGNRATASLVRGYTNYTYFEKTPDPALPASPSASTPSAPAAPSNVRIIGGETVASPPKVATAPPATTTQSSAASPCRARMSEPNKWKKNEVQKFDDALVADLCERQEQSTGPADCFQYVMSGNVAWDTGPPPRVNWQPANALKLCKMTPHGTATAQCFETLVARKTPWAEAIESCRVTDPSGARLASAKPAATSKGPDPAPGVVAAATGRNVTVVEIGQPGRKLGEFRQTAPKQWAESNLAGAIVFRFEETQRDDGSVYLVDRSRGVNLQLDLSTRKVMYNDAGSKPRALYDITTAR